MTMTTSTQTEFHAALDTVIKKHLDGSLTRFVLRPADLVEVCSDHGWSLGSAYKYLNRDDRLDKQVDGGWVPAGHLVRDPGDQLINIEAQLLRSRMLREQDCWWLIDEVKRLRGDLYEARIDVLVSTKGWAGS
jgi:hypothetical protein